MPQFAAAGRPLEQDWTRAYSGENVEPGGFLESFRAAARDQVRVRNDGVREEQALAAVWARHREAERRLGRRLPLPEFLTGHGEGSDRRDPLERAMQALIPTDRINAALLGRPGAVSDTEYEQLLQAERAKAPELFAGIETIAEMEARLDARWREISGEAEALGASSGVARIGQFAGGMAGTMADPANLVVAVATGGAGAGRSFVQRAGAQVLAGGGTELLTVPGRMEDARRFGGPEVGLGDAAVDVLFAGAGAGAFEGVGSVLSYGWRRATGTLSASARPEARGLADALERDLADADAIGPADGDTADLAQAAIARAQTPPTPAPERDLADLFADEPATPGNASQRVEPGALATQVDPGALRAEIYQGRRIYSGTFDPLQVQTDPARFQYKADADGQGVTTRLRGVERWDPTAAGKVMIFEDLAGGRFIADGHQRRGLAARLAEQGWEDARLDGFLFREADGWTPAAVRTLAALKNIKEGSGTILDAAKVFRDAPAALNDRSLPVTGELIASARGLARLSDGAFGAVINKVIPERYGAAIGELAAGRADLHDDLVKLLKDGDPRSLEEARALIHEGLLDDFLDGEGVQGDLFGGLPRKSTTVARGQIRAALLAKVRKDRRINAFLVQNADALETRGLALARSDHEKALAVDNALQAIISKLAFRAGPFADGFGTAAAAVVKGETSAAKAADGLMAGLRAAVKDGDALAVLRKETLDPDPPAEAAITAAAEFDEPGGPGQRAQLEGKPEEAELDAATDDLFPDLIDEEVMISRAINRLKPCAPGTAT